MTFDCSRKFRKLVKTLRQADTVSRPVRVVRRNMRSQHICGSCTIRFERAGVIRDFRIEISTHLDCRASLETLLHEWAHAMDQDKYGIAREPHRASWGKCYAVLWKIYLAEF